MPLHVAPLGNKGPQSILYCKVFLTYLGKCPSSKIVFQSDSWFPSKFKSSIFWSPCSSKSWAFFPLQREQHSLIKPWCQHKLLLTSVHMLHTVLVWRTWSIINAMMYQYIWQVLKLSILMTVASSLLLLSYLCPLKVLVTKRWRIHFPQSSCNFLALFTFPLLQCVSQNFWRMVSEVCLKFPKFATNLAISLRSCQSNCELGNEVVNFTTNFVGKLRSSSREVCTIRCKCLGIFLEVVVTSIANYWFLTGL